MNFVKVEKNKNSAPTESQLRDAMAQSGGTNISVEGDNASRTVTYSGVVNHNAFENKLIEIVPGARRNSWNFVWADAVMTALALANENDSSDQLASIQVLNALLDATQKSVKIEISAADLTLMKNSGYCLCFAKKVGDFAYNVVWQSYDNYLTNNTFSWTPQYELFGSNSFQDNVTVDVSTNKVLIGLGETSLLDEAGLLGEAYTGGALTSLTMRNKYGPIHPGVNQISYSSMGKSVSTPIYVAQNQIVLGDTVLTPVEKVLVWFEQNMQTSTMFSSSRSESIEVDLTSTNAAVRRYSGGKWSTP